MDAQAPVAELISEAFHQDGPAAGKHTGGGTLVGQVVDQVGGGVVVQTSLTQHGARILSCAQFVGELCDGHAQLGGASGLVATPEGQAAGLAGGGGDYHLVGGDLLDPP